MLKPRFFLALAVPLCVAAATFGSAALAGNERVSNRLIVKYKVEDKSKVAAMGFTPGEERVRALNASGPGSLVRKRSVDVAYVKSIAPQTHVMMAQRKMNRLEMSDLARNIAQDPNVEYAEVDEIAYPHLVPSDPGYGNQWNLQAHGVVPGGANLLTVWDTYNGAGVVVAVIDSGYRPHADFLRADMVTNNIINGYDFVSKDGDGIYITANDGDGRDASALDPGDAVTSTTYGCELSNSSWHGTHVAGVIAAAINNGTGMVGVAHGSRVLAVRALGVCGGYEGDIVAALRWAAGLSVPGVPDNTNVAKVINMSLGSSGACTTTYQQAVDAARAAGSVIVASTGNSASSQIGKPANCKGVIAVTANTKLGDNATYANIGVGTALSAPGGGLGSVVTGDGSGIYSTANSGTVGPVADNYVSYNGTSFSAAHVSGVAALIFQAKPSISVDEVEASLVNSAVPHPAGTYCENRQSCGSGMLDAQAAVSFALGNSPFTTATSDAAGAVASGTTVTLIGSATTGNSFSPIASYQWAQLAGPAVTIVNSTSPTATFVMPKFASGDDSAVYFRFRATNMLGSSSDSRVGVQVAVPVAAAPVSTGGGGGGGRTDWWDLAGLALLALVSLALGKRAFLRS